MFPLTYRIPGECGKGASDLPTTQPFQKRPTDQTEMTSDLIWQHKQENIGLKRFQRDFQNEYNTVKYIQKQYENDINKKQVEHRKMIRNFTSNEINAKTDHQQKLNKLLKERHGQSCFADQELKTGTRKYSQRILEMTKKYNTKLQELERKKQQINSLMERHEQCIRKNQSEKQNIEKELQNLKTSIKMENAKGETFQDKMKSFQNAENKKLEAKIQETKKVFEENNRQSNEYACFLESEMTKLNACFTKTQETLKQRERKAKGHLIISDELLKTTLSSQKKYLEEVDENKMSSKLKESKKRIEDHNTRRAERLLQRRNSILVNKWKVNLKTPKTDPDLHIFEDNLNHLQSTVAKGKNREVILYKQVRQAEHGCHKLRRSVTCLQNHLQELRERNERCIQRQIKAMDDQEREIQQNLQKEMAQLSKKQAQRDGYYKKLQDGRSMLKEDTHILLGFQKQHQRQKKIAEKQQTLSAWL